jgi:threonine/homoserine/homoserine lactone efflux protein
MLGPTIADLLPAAVAVALSPIPIVAIVVVLGTRRGRVNGVMFALGWVVGLVVVSAVVVGLLGGADRADSGPATAASAGQAMLGLLLLGLAARKWRSRPQGDAEPEMPAWMDTVERLQPLRALALGLALSGLNPKNLALTAAAAASIAQAGWTAPTRCWPSRCSSPSAR